MVHPLRSQMALGIFWIRHNTFSPRLPFLRQPPTMWDQRTHTPNSQHCEDFLAIRLPLDRAARAYKPAYGMAGAELFSDCGEGAAEGSLSSLSCSDRRVDHISGHILYFFSCLFTITITLACVFDRGGGRLERN